MSLFQFDGIQFYGGQDLKIFIDGKLIDIVQVSEEIQVGDGIETPAISAALEGREVVTSSSVGTMIIVSTRKSSNEG